MRAIARDIIVLPFKRVMSTEILEEVACRHDMTVDEMLAPCRKRSLAWVRQEAMWEIRRRTKLSLPQIARRMRLKDHTTVMHGVRRHAARLAAEQVSA